MAKSDPADLTQLLAARKQHKQQSQSNAEKAESLLSTGTAESQLSKREVTQAVIALSPNSDQKKVGRPPGRRSDPNINPLNLLIDEDLIADVRFKLPRLNKSKKPKQTISDLVEGLLQQWVAEN